MGEGSIRAESLSKTFRSITAVRDLSFQVEPGEIYAFLGPNGAGKSTTVRMLCTLTKPTSGIAVVSGADVVQQRTEARLRLGVALQGASVDDKLTGLEFLRLQARLYGLRKTEAVDRIEALKELIDLGPAIERRIGTFSGGMKRRLDLAAALVHAPSVIFLDEPTTGLDPRSRHAIRVELRRLNRDLGVTIFLTTQNLEDADILANRIGIIDQGRLVAEGSPGEMKQSIAARSMLLAVADDPEGAETLIARVEGVREVMRHLNEITVLVDGESAVEKVTAAVREGGLVVESLTVRQPSLDDVFLAFTGGRMTNATADTEA